jgi:hypothetical protein
MSHTDNFARSLAAAQDEILDHSDALARARARLDHPVPRRRPLTAFVVGGTGLAAAAAALLFINTGSDPLTAHAPSGQVAVGDWMSATDDAMAVTFSDGTEVTLEPGTHAQLVSMDAHGAQVMIERGGAHFDVAHRGAETSWHVEAGPFELAVVGTVFDAGWSPETGSFRLDMNEGRVRVTGPTLGDGRSFGGTDVFQVSLNQTAAAGLLEVEQLAHESAGQAKPTPAPVRQAAADTPADVPGSDWAQLARQADYGAAVAAVELYGLERALIESDADALLWLGEAARLSQSAPLAERSYLAVRDRYPRTIESAKAAFELGRHASDVQADHEAAVRWQRVYLAEQPEGALAREALGRLLEAEWALGNRAETRALAAQYLERFPKGPLAGYAGDRIRGKGK